ncbi:MULTISPECIES: type II toxin-antitoxin system PemK/MazF family toxin [unclassified Rhizobium]|uniref:type II toxin-antitoxin system PemK/MazF family toxin n=1 Tax=unclassified Rhizobium TaxID=2613769 RepID=UPI00288B69E9|nr:MULTISPECIES: type II toxin-antitoxin system PemK/MazF family toxin [unclassified Rhizobium]
MKRRKTILMPARPVLAEVPVPPAAANEARQKGALKTWDSSVVTILRKPAAREVYWIAAAPGARKPEFTGYHPGVILRPPVSMSPLEGTVLFVPLTSDPPREIGMGCPLPSYCRQLSENPGPDKERTVWAICDKITTASICRLERYVDYSRGDIHWVPKLAQRDFEAILEGVASAIVPLRTYIENRAGVKHAATLAEVVREHDHRVAFLEEEFLEQLTAPKTKGR